MKKLETKVELKKGGGRRGFVPESFTWDELFDGEQYELTQEDDFPSLNMKQFVSAAARKANEKDLKLLRKFMDGNGDDDTATVIVVQAIPKTDNDTDSSENGSESPAEAPAEVPVETPKRGRRSTT